MKAKKYKNDVTATPGIEPAISRACARARLRYPNRLMNFPYIYGIKTKAVKCQKYFRLPKNLVDYLA